MASKITPLALQQGKTHPLVVQCYTTPIKYKAITGISNAAPVRLTVVGHEVPDGWLRCAVTNVKGMTEINATANAVKDKDYHRATLVDADHIEFNDVDAAGFKTYASGGYLQYDTPLTLTGYKARLQIRDKKNGATLLFEMTTEDGLIGIDTAKSEITLYFDAADFTAKTWAKGYYELEIYKEVTRTVGAVTTTTDEVFSVQEGPVTLSTETAK